MPDGIYITSASGIIQIAVLCEPDNMLISCGSSVARDIMVRLYKAIVEADMYTDGKTVPIDLDKELGTLTQFEIDTVTKRLMQDIPEPPDNTTDGWIDFGVRD